MWKMTRFSCLLLFVCIFGTGTSSSRETVEQGFRVEIDQFVLIWEVEPDSMEIKAVAAEANKLYVRITNLLGEYTEGKITIVLGGPAERPGGQREYPRVDSKGRILLFKFTPDFNNYFSALAHEMVHVFRFDRRWTADWFFEEGFAEFIALRVDSSLTGFPWFDYPTALVAGQWVAKGQDIPLTLLRAKHRELNQPCGAQSYALRAAFFDWLGRTFGDKVVIQAGSEVHAGALGDYKKFFGKPFEQLELDWRTALLAEYDRIADVDILAQRYRQESPIKYQRVCSEGEDF